MILTGAPIDAAEALRIGLIDELVPGDTETGLMARARDLALQVAAMPPLAVNAALDAVTSGADLPLTEATTLEARLFSAASAPPKTNAKAPPPSSKSAHPSGPGNSGCPILDVKRQGGVSSEARQSSLNSQFAPNPRTSRLLLPIPTYSLLPTPYSLFSLSSPKTPYLYESKKQIKLAI